LHEIDAGANNSRENSEQYPGPPLWAFSRSFTERRSPLMHTDLSAVARATIVVIDLEREPNPDDSRLQ
jgi:hypothetical protein